MNFQPEITPTIYVLVQQNECWLSSQTDIKRNFGADVNVAAKVYLSRANPY